MIDFHSHVLPGIDDGSRSVKESLELLAMEKAQGIAFVAATPHFYPEEQSVEDFLRARSDARGDKPAPRPEDAVPGSREERLRQIEALLAGNGGAQSVSEALNDAQQ